MGRIRTIKPEFFKHSALFDAEQETGLPLRLGFAGLWTCCDREGRFKWRPRELKLDVLPYDDCEFSRVLDALATRGFLIQYTDGTEVFGHIPSWKSHQFINNKEPSSKLPEPPVNQEHNALVTRDERVEDASMMRGVKEGKGKEGERKELTLLSIPSTANPVVSPAEVVALWNESTAGRLPAAKLTTKRQATIKTRLKEAGWWIDFQAACAFMSGTPFYRGENDRQWVATLDFALQSGKATELAEKATQPATRGATATSGTTPKPQTAYERDREEQKAEREKLLEVAS